MTKVHFLLHFCESFFTLTTTVHKILYFLIETINLYYLLTFSLFMDFLLGSLAFIFPNKALSKAYISIKLVQSILCSNSQRLNGIKDNDHHDANHHSSKLIWNNINLNYVKKSKKHIFSKLNINKRKLLDNVSGKALPGRITAIMGPSGAGKTSLLNILARQLPYDKHLVLTGHIQINGRTIQYSLFNS